LASLLLVPVVQVPLGRGLLARYRRSWEAERARLQKTVEAAEAERRRIVQDVHDHVLQDLTGLAYELDAARLRSASRSQEDGLLMARTATGLRRAVSDLRTLLVSLRRAPVPDGDLHAGLESLVAGLARSGTTVTLNTASVRDLPAPAAALLHRCAQEALRNIAAHSRATAVDIRVCRDEEEAEMVIDDDGCGFDEARLAEREADGHLGLRGLGDLLADASGSLVAMSAPGRGTRLVARVPLRAWAGHAAAPR
jgi:signal transduction histidine kinase